MIEDLNVNIVKLKEAQVSFNRYPPRKRKMIERLDKLTMEQEGWRDGKLFHPSA